ncbi:hypothetical protein JHK87_006306 [Glycine soja]|nr:hypothetical protein JHK87_006306 [Glycine soja]
MLRKEISQLQKKKVEMKKAIARGSKAEQKAKKKQVEEEVCQLSAKLKGNHAKELVALGYSSGNGNEKSNLDSLVKAIVGVSVTSQPEDTKVYQQSIGAVCILDWAKETMVLQFVSIEVDAQQLMKAEVHNLAFTSIKPGFYTVSYRGVPNVKLGFYY